MGDWGTGYLLGMAAGIIIGLTIGMSFMGRSKPMTAKEKEAMRKRVMYMTLGLTATAVLGLVVFLMFTSV